MHVRHLWIAVITEASSMALYWIVIAYIYVFAMAINGGFGGGFIWFFKNVF